MSQLQITGTITDQAGSQTLAPLYVNGALTTGQRQTVTLQSGDNAFAAPPAGSSGALVIPSGVTGVLTYRTSGASNLAISKSNPSLLTWDTVPTSMTINAATAVGAVEVIYF